jgi:hypothetical protein
MTAAPMIRTDVVMTEQQLTLVLRMPPSEDGDVVHVPTGDWRYDAHGIWRFWCHQDAEDIMDEVAV